MTIEELLLEAFNQGKEEERYLPYRVFGRDSGFYSWLDSHEDYDKFKNKLKEGWQSGNAAVC